ncbi:MAG: O-antigen ligase family protein [Salibacteraceae bacterium]
MLRSWYAGLLFVIVFSMPLGSYLLGIDLGFINVYAFRVVLLISLILLIWNRDLKTHVGPLSKNLFHLLILWFSYGCLSMLWSVSLKSSLKDLFYLATGIVIYLVVVSLLRKAENSFKTVGYAFLCGFAVVNGIALWEIQTGFHFTGPFIDKLNTLAMNHPVNLVPVVTFDNPNNYSTYIILALPIVTFLLKDRWKWSVLTWPVAFYFIFSTGSRLGMIAFWVLLIGWIGLSYYNPNIKSYLFNMQKTVVGILMVIGITGSIFLTNTFEKSNTMGRLGEPITLEIPSDPHSSGNVRAKLMLNGWDYFWQSAGFGIGAGNFRVYTQRKVTGRDTGTTLNPHSWIVEIASQYGLLITVLCLLWI